VSGTTAGRATSELTAAEQLKFGLLASGIAIAPAAQDYIDRENGGRAMTPADYASTSGIILSLENGVWVNAPIERYNPNFVGGDAFVLDLDPGGRLRVQGEGLESAARFWLPPAYHGKSNAAGEPFNSYAHTHGDRVRIAPIEGCAMACHFCNLPYEFRYRRKSVAGLVESVAVAASDPVQPAHHVLISGGTPRAEDFEYVQEVYEAVATGFPQLHVDVMMVPADGLLDVAWLDQIGIAEISINLEIFNRDIARRIMRRKADQGVDRYLDFLEEAAEVMGPGRVRSMLMVGLEPIEDTLAGVEAIAARGCVPVLSPFRPDPATPMAAAPVPDRQRFEEAYLRGKEIAHAHDVALGPNCVPCTHNTLTLAAEGSGEAEACNGWPVLI